MLRIILCKLCISLCLISHSYTTFSNSLVLNSFKNFTAKHINNLPFM